MILRPTLAFAFAHPAHFIALGFGAGVSRFAPGIRAFVIVGAGFRAMPVVPVLAAAVLGAALWNVLLFTVAALVGKNLPRLAAWLDRYNRAAFVVLLVVAAGFALRWLWKRRHPEP